MGNVGYNVASKNDISRATLRSRFFARNKHASRNSSYRIKYGYRMRRHRDIYHPATDHGDVRRAAGYFKRATHCAIGSSETLLTYPPRSW